MPTVRYPVPLTSFRGHELHPALSPDGSRVAFTWNGEKQDNFDIYLMLIGSDAPFRLTFDPAADISPAWSPDGRTIAFLRRSGGERGELLVISAAGGPEHRIRQIRNPELRMSIGRLASVAWSPDGRWIAASHREPEDSSQRIYLFSRTGEMRPLTSIAGIYGDQTPAFSWNGRALAFSRLPGFSTSEIYVLPLDANCNSAGEPRLVTKDKRWSVNPAWLPGGHRILYLAAKHPEAPHELVLTSITSGRRSRHSVPLKGDAVEIAVGRDLVYSQLRQDTNIWRAKIPDAGEAPSLGEVFISSTRDDQKPKYSPDGKRIAFVSSRSGAPEIWVSKGDGTNPVRITNFGGPLVGYMSWSPDGQHLVFHARPDGQADLFVVPAVGGAIKRLTTNAADDTMPSYSRDGRWIYFTSARSRGTQIWKMPEAGGEAVQLTTSGGYRPLESADGKTVFYYAPDNSGIRSVPAGGGPSANVVGPTHDYPSGFAVTAEGIYYPSPPHSGEERFIRFFSFSTAESRPVVMARRPFDFGMTVSPDSRYILFDQYDENGSDLMLIENFRPQ